MPKEPIWMTRPPQTMEERAKILKDNKTLLSSPGPKGKQLREFLKELKENVADIATIAKKQDPLAFFKPSYEQALMLNAWLYGINYIATFTANRIGKTTACIINFLLWIFPNKPAWKQRGILRAYKIGEPGYDEENAHSPRAGTLVQVLARPDISALSLIRKTILRLKLKPDHMLPHYHPTNRAVLQRLQKEIPQAYQSAFPYAPWNKNGTAWIGAPDHDHHTDKIMPIWKQYVPAPAMERFVKTEREMTIKVEGTKKTTVWELHGLSFESKETKWSSGAVDAILLTEGVPPEIFKEAKLRFKTPGIGSHDFTPYDPANSSQTVALAQRIKKGTEGMPLPYAVFEKFSVYNAPVHILPEDKQKGLIASFENDPQGAARLRGEFYSSSNLCLSNLSRDFHLLEGSIQDLMARYPTGQIYRGLDPGLDHPTACAWALLLPTNQWVIYRIMSERGLDIPSRCARIIQLSNNKPSPVGKGLDQYLIETHPRPAPNQKDSSEVVMQTFTDYHTFKKDERTGRKYSLNYILQGLQIHESTHLGPEERVLKLDSLLKADPFTPALPKDLRRFDEDGTAMPPLSPSEPPGSKVYFLKDGPGVMEWILKMEEFYWQRFSGGDNKGQPKDKTPDHGDDELDAICYVVCSPNRWTNARPQAIMPSEVEPEEHLSKEAAILNASMNQQHSFATIANGQQAAFGQHLQTNQQPDDEDDESDSVQAWRTR